MTGSMNMFGGRGCVGRFPMPCRHAGDAGWLNHGGSIQRQRCCGMRLVRFARKLQCNDLDNMAFRPNRRPIPISVRLRCIAALLSPRPGIYGSTADDVQNVICVKRRRRAGKLALAEDFALCRDKLACAFVDLVRTSEAWQALHTTYLSYMGAEAARGPHLENLEVKLGVCLDSVAAGMDEGTEQELGSTLDDYLKDIADFRTKLRPGATEKLDLIVASLTKKLLSIAVGQKPLDLKKIQFYKDLAQTCNDETLQQSACDALLDAAETSKMLTLASALNTQLVTRAQVAALYTALKATKNMDKQELADQLKVAIPKVMQTFTRVLHVGTVDLDMLAPWLGAFSEFGDSAFFATTMGMAASNFQLSLSNLTKIGTETAKMRMNITAFGIARAKEGGDDARRALLSLRTQVTVVQKLSERQLAVEGFLTTYKDQILALATLLIEGGNSDSGASVTGLLAIMSEAAREVLEQTRARLDAHIADLSKIAGGDPKSANVWHHGLSSDASFADTHKRAKQTVLVSNGRKIEEVSDALKQVACGSSSGGVFADMLRRCRQSGVWPRRLSCYACSEFVEVFRPRALRAPDS